ncbi:hypothetical protein [Providencia stuartii]|uniref:hypothetical protein n=1 Tax=Providencia stuartii TaxID=588 RepID=UPI00300C0A84
MIEKTELEYAVMAELGRAAYSLLSPNACKLDENRLIAVLKSEHLKETDEIRKEVLEEAIATVLCKI